MTPSIVSVYKDERGDERVAWSRRMSARSFRRMLLVQRKGMINAIMTHMTRCGISLTPSARIWGQTYRLQEADQHC